MRPENLSATSPPPQPMPGDELPHTGGHEQILILADLHMGAGRDARGRLDRNEDFVDDDALAAFLEHRMRRGQATGSSQRLIPLRALLELPPVERGTAKRGGRLDMSADAALRKLDRIAAGHR